MRARIVRNRPATLQVTLFSGETASEPDSATVEIIREDGTTLVAETAAALGTAGDGIVTYDLAAQSDLDVLTVKWASTYSGSTVEALQTVEVVGGVYFSLSELRAKTGLDDTAVYPTLALERARLKVEDLFEIYTGVAWVRRYTRLVLDGPGLRRRSAKVSLPGNAPTSTLQLPWRHDTAYPRTIVSASVDGTALTSAELDSIEVYEDGELYYPGGWGSSRRGVVVKYERGHDLPSEDLRQAALKLARIEVLGTVGRIPERAIQMSTEAGQFNLGMANHKRPTGYPEIDAVLYQYNHRIPAIG